MPFPTKKRVAVVGAGISGSEAAWQLAQSGFQVDLYEMRPIKQTEAHQTAHAAELVCSNSFKSLDYANAHGALKAELMQAGSFILSYAQQHSVPAGSALAIDKAGFSMAVTEALKNQPNLSFITQEVTNPTALIEEYDHVILASGPLSSQPITQWLSEQLGEAGLYFYDAIAPVVYADSIDFQHAFKGSRYGKSGDDYINCPMDRETYENFVQSLREAKKVQFTDFEQAKHFEGCLPIEVMAERGLRTLSFGPLKPVGLNHPESGQRYHAVLQLRQENQSGSLFNLVGCQTRMTYGEQVKVFRMIPGLGQAEFARLGSMHRNSFINAPRHLDGQLKLKSNPKVQVIGQLTGAEGYTEAVATGFWAAFCLHASFIGQTPSLDRQTMLGGLVSYLQTASPDHFQPMNANWGLIDCPRRPKKTSKAEFRTALAKEGLAQFQKTLSEMGWRGRHT